MRKLTFKEYVESKQRLRRAVSETPIASLTYCIKKYCKIRVGETKDDRSEISLKPNQRVIVEWRYDDINNPEPQTIIFEDQGPEEYPIYWKGSKLKDWLSKNSIEEIF